MTRGPRSASDSSLKRYLSEINRHPLLTAEEEQRLARAYAQGDTRAAHHLITSNLRFVVKIAFEYKAYGLSIPDLIQEGNIGLMKAVQKFDPARGIRFVSYAVWWIRAYLHNHILKSYSLVKLGTTQAQRKLFFSLARTRRELDKTSAGHGADSDGEDVAKIAKKLKVKAADVEQMSERMRRRDVSLDVPVGEDGEATHLDLLAAEGPAHDQEISTAQAHTKLRAGIGAALAELDPRERFIVEQRVMSDEPVSLKDIGAHFGFSRERARQLELRAKTKLGEKLHAVAVEVEWPFGGAASEPEECAFA